MMHRNLLVQNMAKKYNFAKRECLNFYNVTKKLEKENQYMREQLKVAIYLRTLKPKENSWFFFTNFAVFGFQSAPFHSKHPSQN